MNSFQKLLADSRLTVASEWAPDPDGRCVVYRMRRAQRAFDNPALETAIAAANALKLPVVVFFGLLARKPGATLRAYHFMLEGIVDTAERLKRRKIGFALRVCDDSESGAEFERFGRQVKPALVVEDENPLRRARENRSLRPTWRVDADVIVPSRLLQKEQFAARTIRPRIHKLLDQFLESVGNREVHVGWKSRIDGAVDPSFDLLTKISLDRSVGVASGFRGGTTAGLAAKREFVRNRLEDYDTARNHPELDGTSKLSPYLHFGQLGPHTIALHGAKSPAFLEQLIVRRELAVNFVRFNPRYLHLRSCEPWAMRTLGEHSQNPRTYVYSPRALEKAETHDPLWNAAQRQMVDSGWMHNYMRMYWAKKILEWSESPEAAYEVAVAMNDRYELDGRDPNGYAGIAWAIGGKHDRAWGPERPVYGKIRYMSYESTRRKFDSRAYIARWSPREAS
jgi:deoxyribodipyrimidine photo-lyase